VSNTSKEDVVIVTIKVPISLLMSVDSIAEKERVSRSELVRRALRDYISKYASDKKRMVVKRYTLW